jgi:hypothetical protein
MRRASQLAAVANVTVSAGASGSHARALLQPSTPRGLIYPGQRLSRWRKSGFVGGVEGFGLWTSALSSCTILILLFVFFACVPFIMLMLIVLPECALVCWFERWASRQSPAASNHAQRRPLLRRAHCRCLLFALHRDERSS